MKPPLKLWLSFLPLLLAPFHLSATAQTDAPLALDIRAGDRVALIGNTFIEREARYGYIETALAIRFADQKPTFRNLGWSGDTVNCQARAYFGSPKDGEKHLLEHVRLVKPTLLIVNYGVNAALDRNQSLPVFLGQYNHLLDELTKICPRIVLVPPLPLIQMPKPLPDVSASNARIATFSQAIQTLAAQRNHDWLDLSAIGSRLHNTHSDNGIHLTESGYERMAESLSGKGWNSDWQALRNVVQRKNELFFHRHRPQNETYLRGFRKHEQGNNAREITAFEPLVAEQDAAIHALAAELGAAQ